MYVEYAIILHQLVNAEHVGYAMFQAFSTGLAMAERTHEEEWSERAKRYLKAKLKQADVTYTGLAERLNEKGWKESQASVASKLSRGAFTATFFLAVLAEIGCEVIRIEEI